MTPLDRIRNDINDALVFLETEEDNSSVKECLYSALDALNELEPCYEDPLREYRGFDVSPVEEEDELPVQMGNR